MCLNLFSFHNHPNYKFILASNRDEFYSRPTKKANFWEDQATILGGKDLAHGGTWLAISIDGKFGILSNFREISNIRKDAPSRGILVNEFLVSDESPINYARKIKSPEKYNGLNLILSDLVQLVYFTNKEKEPHLLKPGNYALSNAFLDTPWPKVVKGKRLFEEAIKKEVIEVEELFEILTDEEKFEGELLPDTGLGMEKEKDVSSIFIKTDNYGTVSSTVILIDKENNVVFCEKNYLPSNVEPQVKTFNFKLKLEEKV